MGVFSDKIESHNFDYHDFSDVKYLYFLCLEIYSFWVHLGPVLGLEPIEQTLAHVKILEPICLVCMVGPVKYDYN